MPEKTLTLVATDGVPDLEVVIGNAHFGKYQVALYDSNDRNAVVIGSGVNTDTTPDKFSVKDNRGNLNNRVLTWDVVVAAFVSGPGQNYSVTIRISQRGVTVPGGEFQYKGQLDGVEIVSDILRLKVQ